MITRDENRRKSVGRLSSDAGRAESRAEERELLRACQSGDQEAFERLVARYEKKVLWIARGMLGSPEDAEDLAQEAFIRVHRSLDRFNLDYNFYTWLYRIVVNLCIDHLRKNGRHGKVSLDDVPGEPAAAGGPEREVQAKELGATIRKVLDALPAKYRTVLVLRDVEQLDCETIAKIIHCTSATTRWRLHRARELFAEAWARAGQPAP